MSHSPNPPLDHPDSLRQTWSWVFLIRGEVLDSAGFLFMTLYCLSIIFSLCDCGPGWFQVIVVVVLDWFFTVGKIICSHKMKSAWSHTLREIVNDVLLFSFPIVASNYWSCLIKLLTNCTLARPNYCMCSQNILCLVFFERSQSGDYSHNKPVPIIWITRLKELLKAKKKKKMVQVPNTFCEPI